MRAKCVTVKLPNQMQQRRLSIAMNSVTQDMRFRQSLLKYSQKYGVTKAAIKYKTNRQYIYRWLRRYDGTLESLRDRSRRPHHHPNQHNEEELKLIKDMRRRNPEAGLVVFWVKLRQRGYTRRLNSDKVLFSFARGRERCDRNGHAVFLRPGVDFATTGSEITGISTSSTKLK